LPSSPCSTYMRRSVTLIDAFVVSGGISSRSINSEWTSAGAPAGRWSPCDQLRDQRALVRRRGGWAPAPRTLHRVHVQVALDRTGFEAVGVRFVSERVGVGIESARPALEFIRLSVELLSQFAGGVCIAPTAGRPSTCRAWRSGHRRRTDAIQERPGCSRRLPLRRHATAPLDIPRNCRRLRRDCSRSRRTSVPSRAASRISPYGSAHRCFAWWLLHKAGSVRGG
jgi:hypothetical protein